jgi:hypothetical protein
MLSVTATTKQIAIHSRRVRIEDGHIVWQSESDLNKVRALSARSLSGAKLLEDFVWLANRSEGVLLKFARKYGPLGLCKHGFATGHRDRFNKRCYESGCGMEDLKRGVRAREPVEGWHRYIARADGVLTVANKLHRKEKATEQDWSWLFDGIPRSKSKATRLKDVLERKGYRLVCFGTEDPRPYVALLTAREGDVVAANPLITVLAAHRRDNLNQQRQALAAVLNHWLDECETGVSVAWPESGLDVRLGVSDPLGGGNRLLIAIGVQLLNAVLNQEVYYRCAHCHRTYRPKKQPRAGENHYCHDPECHRAGNTERQRRLRNRKYYQRKGVQK